MQRHSHLRGAARAWFRWTLGLGLLGGSMFTLGWFLGEHQLPTQAVAAPPPATVPQPASAASVNPASADYGQRVVAHIYGNIAITRQELGEYLIARYGTEKLDLLVNKRIIDHACQSRGIEVTEAEIDASFEEDLKRLNVDRAAFVENVLRHYNTTLYSWRQDVIKPRLQMTKLCQDRVKVLPEDVQKAFESRYGEKVDLQIILYPHDQERFLHTLYDQIRKSDDAFMEAARKQPDSKLAMTAGRIKPIGHHSGMPEVEKVAFSLKEGEVSHVIGTREGCLIMKCVQRIPPETKVALHQVQAELSREVFAQKLQQEIPKFFKEMTDQAKPVLYLAKEKSREELDREIKQDVGDLLPPNVLNSKPR